MVGSLDEFQRRVHRVARQSGDQEESVLAASERFHGFARQRPVVVVEPIVRTDGTVVGSTQQRQFLVKTRFVVSSGHTQGNPLCGDQIVQLIRGGPVLQHFEERKGEVCVELVSIDGFSGRSA